MIALRSFVLLLARCIARNVTGGRPSGKPVVQKLLQFAVLAVGKGVHRVDDERLMPAPEPRRKTWLTIGTM